jgi:NAD(P)-dependent dehydrogenase (short-subunit alcohol dehydrogenase family)
MLLTNKVAIVAGGSLGTGAGIARRLAQEGAAVTLDYRSHQVEANAIAREITSAGGKALVVQVDVSSVASVRALVRQTVQAFVRLDILVNNAGIEQPLPFLEVLEESFDR